jgi:anthranilate/para-aminobenzoate synthase component I
MLSKTWQSNLCPLEYFASVKSEGAFLLLAKEQKSFIGLRPLRMFTSLKEVESFLCEYPLATVLGFKSYPDTHKVYTCALPTDMWLAFAEVIEISVNQTSFDYKQSFLDVPAQPMNFSPQVTSALQFFEQDGMETSIAKYKYLETIDAIKNDICNGDYYQANFTFAIKKTSDRDPFELFQSYYAKNPANYFAYFEYQDIQVLSASPELFLQKVGDRLVAKPIKGTISKNHSSQDLVNSEKDRAELNMITDLFRNDLYKICDRTSVEVKKQHAVLELEQLYHLYSQVEGNLKDNVSLEEIFAATFPSGSITGCPKIRSQAAIGQYENHARGIYTGSIGWIQKDSFCMSIAIRTTLAQQGNFYYHVGGGIVYDSKPESEWAECMLKAKTFLDSL